jgi:hypothetical protein
MKKKFMLAATSTAAAVVIQFTALPAGPAGAAVRHSQEQTGAITLQSWLFSVPSDNVLSTTVWECFKITGALNDEGGGPTWTNSASYMAPNSMTTGAVAAAGQECAHKMPAGGFVLIPPPEPGQFQFAKYTSGAGSPGGLTTVYANHMIAGQKGDIFITFAGTANFTNSVVPVKLANGSTVDVQPLTSGPQSSWVITGGTGAYIGLHGSGTWFANAQNTFPWINHTDQGAVWWGNQS